METECEHEFEFSDEVRTKVEIWACALCDAEETHIITNPFTGEYEVI